MYGASAASTSADSWYSRPSTSSTIGPAHTTAGARAIDWNAISPARALRKATTSGSCPGRRARRGATPFATDSPGYWSSTISREGAWKRPLAALPRYAPTSSRFALRLSVNEASTTISALA